MVLTGPYGELAEPWGVPAMTSERGTGTREEDGQGAKRKRSGTPGDSGIRSQILSSLLFLLPGSSLCCSSPRPPSDSLIF